ncbi:hypothetical protein W02_38440 [Nitrospira sp. KM1]|uniref:hypothetical protein n=1 Tax=Nitrospira sp. KM1 TaxID=1936990 RepID=UPI0013A78FD3|nr:hypothetical protein [Nitrospira sp. KM1]BCA56704.1 hypothetical protein W02_38440 [Nitrospira sp. KM1]
MGKKKAEDSEETTLKKKVASKLTGHENPEGDPALRSLRKRLKREQRRRRSLALRKKNAAGSKPAEAASLAS